MRPSDFGLMFFLVQCPVQTGIQRGNLLGPGGIAQKLDISPTPFIAADQRAEDNQQGGASDPCLLVSDVGNLCNEPRVGDDPKGLGLFVPTGRRQPPGFQHFLEDGRGDGLVLITAHARPFGK